MPRALLRQSSDNLPALVHDPTPENQIVFASNQVAASYISRLSAVRNREPA